MTERDHLDILQKLKFPALRVSPDRTGGIDTDRLALHIVDFEDFLTILLDATKNKLSAEVRKEFGHSIALCQVGSYRSVVGEQLLNMVGVEMKSVPGQRSSTYDFISYTFAVSKATLDEGGYVVIDGAKTDTVLIFMSLGRGVGQKVKTLIESGNEDLTEMFSLSGGRDSTAISAWRFLAQSVKERTKTRAIIVNVDETEIIPAFEGKEDELKRVFGSEAAEELMTLVRRRV